MKAMRREGNIIQEITEYSNVEESFCYVLRGPKRHASQQGRLLIENKENVIADISRRISDGSFRIKDYHIEEIVEAGKKRKLIILSLYDRIAINAIMTVVDKHVKPRLIRTTSASIKGRGMHDLMLYIHRDMVDDPDGTQYAYKFDIHHFYECVDQDIMMSCVRHAFKDEKLIEILDRLVRILPKGIGIGPRSSQGLGNLLLSVYLDHVIKDEHAIPYFYRYCDDGLILAGSKSELWVARDIVHDCIEAAGLTIKNNERIFPVTEGIDFLGYVIRPDYVRLRKRVKQNFARKIKDVKSKGRRQELIASFYGMAKHADCENLFYILTNKNMKSFKDLSVTYKPADGKKRFAGAVVSIRELVNLPIIVKDFETGIKTEQGEDRCIVSIEQDGVLKKFFTNSEEMKNILAQIQDIPGGFPFETTIKSETFGKGRTKYIFS